MRKSPKTISAEPTEAEIQHAAYLRWIEEGRPAGRDVEHWLAAKELLRHRAQRDLGHLGQRLAATGPDLSIDPDPEI